MNPAVMSAVKRKQRGPVLLKIAAGTDPRAAGVVFTGDANRWYFDASGNLQNAPANRPRYAAWVRTSQGAWVQVILLEGQRACALLQSASVNGNNGPWSFVSDIQAAGVVAVNGLGPGLTGWKNTEVGTTNQASRRAQIFGTFSGGAETISAIVESADADRFGIGLWGPTSGYQTQADLIFATGAIVSAKGTVIARKIRDVGPNGGIVYLLRCTGAATPAGEQRNLFYFPDGQSQATAKGSIVHVIWHELGSFGTSPIITAGAAVTRATEIAYLPWTIVPGAMSVYSKNVDLGLATAGGQSFLWSFGDGRPRFFCYGTGPYQVGDQDGGVLSVFSTPGFAIQYGDDVEVRAVLYPDGSVRAAGSLNGAAEVNGGRSATPAFSLPQSWNVKRLVLGAAFVSGGVAPAFAGLESFTVATGERDLAYLRSL